MGKHTVHPFHRGFDLIPWIQTRLCFAVIIQGRSHPGAKDTFHGHFKNWSQLASKPGPSMLRRI